MRLKDYPEQDGKRVWLAEDELQDLIAEAQTPEHTIAFLLAGRVGLRRSEIVQVRPVDFVEGPTGQHVRIWEDYAKRDKYREPPVPDELVTTVNTWTHDEPPDEPVVGRHDDTVRRWVQRAADRRQAATGDVGWRYVGPHDLRRTWGTYLLEQGVLPSVVMEWGGWLDWDTFRQHYLGEFSPEAIKRERAKVSYLGGEPVEASSQNAITPVGSHDYRTN